MTSHDPDPVHLEIARLVLSQRWAALATVRDGRPLASMVAYAPAQDLDGLLLFLSGLAEHTGNLRADPHASLAISNPDPGRGDPQELARATLLGTATVVARDSPEFVPAWSAYVTRLPAAASRLLLADFDLFRLAVDEIRYVGGFARATSVGIEELRAAARALES